MKKKRKIEVPRFEDWLYIRGKRDNEDKVRRGAKVQEMVWGFVKVVTDGGQGLQSSCPGYGTVQE